MARDGCLREYTIEIDFGIVDLWSRFYGSSSSQGETQAAAY
jgi:hypothetical protein